MDRAGDAPATKGDLQALRRDLAVEFLKVLARVDVLEERGNARLVAVSSGLLDKIDAAVSRTEKVDRAQVIVDWRLTELEKRMAAIEPRPS